MSEYLDTLVARSFARKPGNEQGDARVPVSSPRPGGEAGIAPFRTAVEQASSMPGVKDPSARAIISEIGIDRSRFATNAASHFNCTAACGASTGGAL